MTDSDVPQKRTIRYYSCEDLASHASIEACMLKPNMVRLAHELVKACQLPQHMAMCTTGSTECPLLTAGGAMCFHTDAYVDFLQQIAYNSAEVAAESADYALQSSVCFSETAWCAAAAAAAAAPPHRRRLAFRTWRCVDAAQSPPRLPPPQALRADVRRRVGGGSARAVDGRHRCGDQLDGRADARTA
jgi:hypothetical protein